MRFDTLAIAGNLWKSATQHIGPIALLLDHTNRDPVSKLIYYVISVDWQQIRSEIASKLICQLVYPY